MIIPLQLTGWWLTDLSGVSVKAQGEAPWPDDPSSVTASVQDYAGRRRIISTAEHSSTVSVSLLYLSSDDVAQLRAWAGQLLLFRTPMWRRWGMYATVTPTPLSLVADPSLQHYRVKFDWTDIDYSEAI